MLLTQFFDESSDRLVGEVAVKTTLPGVDVYVFVIKWTPHGTTRLSLGVPS
jgi:hypothetical protein